MELVGQERVVVVPDLAHVMVNEDDALVDAKTPHIMSVMSQEIVVVIRAWI